MVLDIKEEIDLSRTSEEFITEVEKSNMHRYLPALFYLRTNQLDTNSEIYKSFLECQLKSDNVPEEYDTENRIIEDLLLDPIYMVQHTYGELIALGCITGEFFLNNKGKMPAEIISPEGLIKAKEKYEDARRNLIIRENNKFLTWLDNLSQCDKVFSSGILEKLDKTDFFHNMKIDRTPMLETGYRGVFLAAYESLKSR